MLVYKDYVTFKVMGEEINLISDETAYGRNTVAELDKRFYQMGDELPNVATAVFAWQEVNGRDLTSEEIHQVMVENGLSSDAI